MSVQNDVFLMLYRLRFLLQDVSAILARIGANRFMKFSMLLKENKDVSSDIAETKL